MKSREVTIMLNYTQLRRQLRRWNLWSFGRFGRAFLRKAVNPQLDSLEDASILADFGVLFVRASNWKETD